MSLFEKIMSLYPELMVTDFTFPTGSLRLQNDSDGKGDYIAAWDHPVSPKPTPEQLEGVTQ